MLLSVDDLALILAPTVLDEACVVGALGCLGLDLREDLREVLRQELRLGLEERLEVV